MNWKEQVEKAAESYAQTPSGIDFREFRAFEHGATWEKERAEIQAAALPVKEEPKEDVTKNPE